MYSAAKSASPAQSLSPDHLRQVQSATMNVDLTVASCALSGLQPVAGYAIAGGIREILLHTMPQPTRARHQACGPYKSTEDRSRAFNAPSYSHSACRRLVKQDAPLTLVQSF